MNERCLLSGGLHLEVATGGNPVEALKRAVVAFAGRASGLFHVRVAHDEGCPCTAMAAAMDACTCEIVELLIVRDPAA